MLANSIRKAILLLAAVLAVVIANPTPTLAANGIWFYFEFNQVFTISLVNLTDFPLTATVNNVSTEGVACFCSPFKYFGINVAAYNTAVWKSYPATICPGKPPSEEYHCSQYYSGKITLLPNGMDQKWSFDLNFYPQNPHSGLEKGTWVYLTPTNMTPDYSLHGWLPSWDPSFPEWYPWFNGYGTRLNDGKMHNLMNLLGWELAVSVFSQDNMSLVVVVQSTHGKAGDTNQPPEFYDAWMLDWVDNDSNSVP